MKSTNHSKAAPFSPVAGNAPQTACIVLALFLLPAAIWANPPAPGGGGSSTPALNTWSFFNTNTWVSDGGYGPVSFTNLSGSILGDATALVVDSSNSAWLRYNVTESSGSNNLSVSVGTVMFWFAPNWSGTNAGGTGPGVWGRLVEAGTYTTNASYGWWSLYTDPAGVNLYFGAQTNNGAQATYLSAPITWTTNYWHLIALTYTSTNSALYVDGLMLTNGLPVTYWPNSTVLSNGFSLGSDAGTGLAQAHGMMDDVATYNTPLSGSTISATFLVNGFYYYANPMNKANMNHAQYNPDPGPTLDAITGQGQLQLVGPNSTNCVTSSSVWITNAIATPLTNHGANLTFTITGGADGVPYDVFANAALGPTNATAFQWAWMGQGYHCYTYGLTNLSPYYSFVILGTPQDSDDDGLTDAFERLVSHTNPNSPDTLADGISDLYKVLHGLSLTNLLAVPTLGSISIPTCPVQ